MAKKDTMNFVSLVADLGRTLFLDDIVVQISDIIKALGIESREGLKPIVCHHHRIPTGWHVVINVPIGLCSDDILHWMQYFEEHLKAYIEPEVKDNKVHLDIHTKALTGKDGTPYIFNPADYPDMAVPIPIGYSHTGLEVVDLSRLPHLFVAGSVGSGKTVELKNIAQACLQQNAINPGSLELTVIDLKRLDFVYLQNHCHLAETFDEALEILLDTKAQMWQRINRIRKKGCSNWHEYMDKGGKMPYKVVVFDELGELSDLDNANEQEAMKRTKRAQRTLESLVKLCRAAGISIVAATQRPSAKVWKTGEFREVISLFDARICYRTVDTHNSAIVLGEGNHSAFTHIKLTEKGRGIWKYDGETLVQSMYIKDPVALVKTIPTAKKVEKDEQLPKPTPEVNRFSPE